MPDYNLGRAHGDVVITADVSDVNRGMGQYEQAMNRGATAAKNLDRIEGELNQRRQTALATIQRRTEAENNYRAVMKDSNSTLQQQAEAEIKRNTARAEAEQAARRLTAAENAHRAAVEGNTDAVRKFVRTLDDGTVSSNRFGSRLRDMRSEITQTSLASKALGDALSSTLGTIARATAITGGIGAAGGLAGLLGAGGVSGIMSVVEAVKDFSGAVALAPAAVGGFVAVLGTLAVAFNGVGDALQSMDDPAKFQQALQNLAPAAAQAVTILASFEQSFKGAMQAIQQSFFEPLVSSIQPIVYQWLPLLMQAGQQIASVLGEAGRQIAQWLQQTTQTQAFQTFIQNVVTALNQMLPAITPVLDAFRTLVVVGSQFLPQIAQVISQIATSFNEWVQGAAASGGLQAWIQTAINSFGQLFTAIGNIVDAFTNINQAFQASGSRGMLQWLVDITKEFRNWTQSVEGSQAITTFFQNIARATQILGPILRITLGALGDLLNNLVNMGIQMGPGITTLFQSLATALNVLGQSLAASGPALGQILTTLGNTLVQIVQRVGPQLPKIFDSLSQALINIAPAAVAVAGALADIMANLTPGEIETILGIVAAFQAVATIIPIIQALSAALMFLAANPIVLVIAAVAALVVGIIYAYNHSETFRNAVNKLWEDIQRVAMWLFSEGVRAFHAIGEAIQAAIQGMVSFGTDIVNAVTGAWNEVRSAVGNWFTEAYDWGKNIVSRLIDGIKAMFQPLSDAWDWLTKGAIDDKNPHSPPKKGPLSGSGDPLAAGQRVSERFATGIQAGAPAVSGAYDNAIGGGAGGGFSSAGTSSRATGVGGTSAINTGQSGFDQWIQSLTQDMQSWHDLIAHSFDLFQKVSDIFVQSTKIVASVWNRGDNPLTRPGGIAGPPQGTPQQAVPGVPQAAGPAGKAPLPELTPQYYDKSGTPAVPQQSVPGVPQAGPKPATGAPPANPPASTTVPPPSTGQPPPAAPGAMTVPLTQNADGTWTSPNQAWAHLIQRESSGINQRQQITDVNSGGNEAEGLFQITPDTWKRHGGTEFAPTAISATPQQQAQVAARILQGNKSGSDWGAGLNGREDAQALLSGLTPIAPVQGPPILPVTADGTPKRQLNASDFGGINLTDQGQVSLGGGPNAQRQRRGAAPVAPPSIAPAQRPGAPTSQNGWTVLDDQSQTVAGPFGSRLAPGAPAAILGDFANWFNENIEPVTGTSSWRAGGAFDRKIGSQHISGTALDINPDDFPGYSGGQSSGAPASSHFSPQQIQAIRAKLASYGGAVYWGEDFGGKSTDPMHFELTGASYSDQPGGPTNQAVVNAYTQLMGEGMKGGSDPVRQPANVQGGGGLFGSTGQASQEDQRRAAQRDPNAPLFGPQGQATPQEIAGAKAYQSQWFKGPLIGPSGGATPSEVAAAQAANPPASPGLGNRAGQPLAQQFDPNQSGVPANTSSPLDTFQNTMAAAGTIAGDAFQVFDDVIKSIGAAANITDTLVRGFANTQDVMGFIDNMQQFITTAADVAKLVGDTAGTVGKFVGAGGAGDPSGSTSAVAAAFGTVSAVAGLVQSGLEATNMAIDLGQEAWKMVSKYGATFAGLMLGNDQTGPLGGNVRMLLNTNTNQLMAYSEDNPLNKSTQNLAPWLARSYGGRNPNAQPNVQNNQLNMYVGPGNTPTGMMQDSMWMVSTGAPSVASVAGQD